MGNQASRAGTVQDLGDLPDAVLKSSLGGSRFLKTSLALHDEGGLVVVKSYKRSDDATAADVRQYEDRVLAVRSALAAVPAPHVWPTQRIYHSDKAVHLVRQYFASNLAARISSRPFLTPPDKRWLGYQIIAGVAQAHAAGICHGDIKAENVLLTSWGWALLADFAPYKPTMLPADNPADFSFFFDTSGRRKCYLAPERFYDSGSAPAPSNNTAGTLTQAMDVFAAGCVLAELFADGEPLFDYSRLLAFRTGDYDPSAALSALGDSNVAAVVAHMTQLDPNARLSAAEYLEMYASTVMADKNVVQVVAPFLATALAMEGDRRAEMVARGYPELKRKLIKTDVQSGVDVEEAAEDNNDVREGQQLSPLIRAEQEQQQGQQQDENFGSSSFIADQLQQHATELLVQAKSAVAALGDKNTGAPAVEQQPHASTMRQHKATSAAHSSTQQHSKSTARALTDANDSLVVVLALLCAVLRGSRRQSIRVKLVEQVCDCAVLCGDNEAQLQRAVPQLVAAATDLQFAAVRCAALRALPKVLSCVARVPPGDARAFADYLFPSLSLLPADLEPSVQAAYAGVLAAIALEARNAIEKANEDETNGGGTAVRYDEELGRLRSAVERAVHDLLVGARPEPKLALLPHLSDLSKMLGRRDTADGLLPALLTLFNSREWEVRTALYSQLAGVCPALGHQGVAFLLLPFLDRMLSDPEAAAVAAAAELLGALCRHGLMRQRHILVSASKVMEAGLLKSECTAVRAAATEFVASAAGALPRAAAQALLLPLVRPHLTRNPSPLDVASAVVATLKPRSFKQSTSTAAAQQQQLPLTLPCLAGTYTAPNPAAPATSYSVMIDPRHLRRGTSWLSAALQQAAQQSAGSAAAAGSPTVPLLVAAAQRNITRSAVPGVGEEEAAVAGRTVLTSGTVAAPSSLTSTSTHQPDIAAASEQPQRGTSWRPRGVLVAHLAEHTRQISRLSSVPGTPLFISASEDGTAKVWDARRLERDISFRPRVSYEGHSGGSGVVGIRAVTSLLDGSTIVTGGSDGGVHSWQVERGGGGDAGGRWAIGSARIVIESCAAAGPVMDMHGWGHDIVILSRAGTGVAAVDLRAPPGHAAWRLPCSPSAGIASRLLCTPYNNGSSLSWVVTGTTRGALSLWDVRFLLPVTTWSHPKGASIAAMALDPPSPLALSSTPPLVYVAAGKDEIVAWDAGSGVVKKVIRLAANTEGPQGAIPEALSAAPPDIGTAGDPLARARQLGATELRTMAAHRSGFRSLLAVGGSQILTGGSDCAVRCWDAVEPQHSYVVVAPPPPPQEALPKWSYGMRNVGQVSVIEERPAEIVTPRRGSAGEDAKLVEERQRAARWWDRAAVLCHQQSVVDMAKVEGHAEPLLATAGADGIIKVWR